MSAILISVVGAFVGKFLNMAANQLPTNGSLGSLKSYCQAYGGPPRSIQLVPIIGYLWSRSKCECCGRMRTQRIMLVEISTSLLFTITYLRFGFSPETLLLNATCALLIIIAVIDIEHGLILNRIMLPSLIALLLLAPFLPHIGISRPLWGNSSSLVSLTNSLIAGGGAFLVFLTISLIFPQSIGDGDPKLAGLVGLMVGFPEVLFALWGAVISGGIVCSLLIVLHKKKMDDTIPFGTFLSLGGIVVMLARPEIIRAYQVIVNTHHGS